MGKNEDQIVTSRVRVADVQAQSPSDPDEATDLSLPGLQAAARPWRLNSLGAVLLIALVCALAVIAVLAMKLVHTRAELAEAETAAEEAAAAVARAPERDEGAADEAVPAPAPRAAAAPASASAPASAARPPAQVAAQETGAPPPDRLVLLLTVGTRHFAEKQLKNLRKRCPARLAVYQQLRGRCAYSKCFAVAAPAEDPGLSRGCGQLKGQSLRDRSDFSPP